MFSATLGTRRYTFLELKKLLVMATPLRSGDALAGLTAGSGEERVAAQFALADHAAPVLLSVRVLLRKEAWRIAPVILVRNGRVGIGDEIAAVLGATCAVVLIGERPGLSAPDSIGAYLREPRPETTPAERNCISNIRPDGIGYADAAEKIVHLLRAMQAPRLSGVRLKDDFDRNLIGR